jgi:hypothetical protein
MGATGGSRLERDWIVSVGDWAATSATRTGPNHRAMLLGI